MEQESENKRAAAAFRIAKTGSGQIRLELAGALTHEALGLVWNPCVQAVRRSRPKTLVIDAQQVTRCDGAGIGLLTFLLAFAKKRKFSAFLVMDDMGKATFEFPPRESDSGGP